MAKSIRRFLRAIIIPSYGIPLPYSAYFVRINYKFPRQDKIQNTPCQLLGLMHLTTSLHPFHPKLIDHNSEDPKFKPQKTRKSYQTIIKQFAEFWFLRIKNSTCHCTDFFHSLQTPPHKKHAFLLYTSKKSLTSPVNAG